MGNLDEYRFDRPLEKIGITSYAVDDLRKLASHLIIQIKSSSVERNKPILDRYENEKNRLENVRESLVDENEIKECEAQINKCSDEIRKAKLNREKLYDFLDKKKIEIYETSDVASLIYAIISLNSTYIHTYLPDSKNTTEDEKEYIHYSRILSKNIKSVDDVRVFLNEEVYITSNIDIENADLSKYQYMGEIKNKYGQPSYVCVIKALEEPEKILTGTDMNNDSIEVYRIGKFLYTQSHNYEGKLTEGTSLVYDVLTVLKQSSKEKPRLYNGFIYFNEYIGEDVNFWANVVFSDLALKNARDNNFGYIGEVELIDGKRKLMFNPELNQFEKYSEIKALSYFFQYGGRVGGLQKCNSIEDFFNIMNDRVNEISELDKKVPSSDSDEGR